MARIPRGGRRGGALIRKARYDSYISSPAWRARRISWAEAEMARTKGDIMCAVCREKWLPQRDDLHHIDYGRMGGEAHGDLVALHRPAHDRVHALIDRMRLTRRLPLRMANGHVLGLLLQEGFKCAAAAIKNQEPH